MSKPYENQYEQHYYSCNKDLKKKLNQITVNVTKFAEHGFSVDWFSTSHVHALMHGWMISIQAIDMFCCTVC